MMKNWCLYLIMILLLASCSEQQVMEETLSSQKLTEQKSMTVSPQDSVMSLLYQARWGDGSAYLKLADCYRDGIGVKKDFFGMITMAHMAEWRGAINRMDDYYNLRARKLNDSINVADVIITGGVFDCSARN